MRAPACIIYPDPVDLSSPISVGRATNELAKHPHLQQLLHSAFVDLSRCSLHRVFTLDRGLIKGAPPVIAASLVILGHAAAERCSLCVARAGEHLEVLASVWRGEVAAIDPLRSLQIGHLSWVGEISHAGLGDLFLARKAFNLIIGPKAVASVANLRRETEHLVKAAKRARPPVTLTYLELKSELKKNFPMANEAQIEEVWHSDLIPATWHMPGRRAGKQKRRVVS